VKEDDREAPSFLFESVENGQKTVNMVHYTSSSSLLLLQEDRACGGVWLFFESFSSIEPTIWHPWVFGYIYIERERGQRIKQTRCTILQGRYSMVGAQPSMEIVAKENRITVLNHEEGTRVEKTSEDPLGEPSEIASKWQPVPVDGLPDVFCGESPNLFVPPHFHRR
jgi:hypothetical protein